MSVATLIAIQKTLGALGGIASFVSTFTIIPFMPDGWAASAGGFPATGGPPTLFASRKLRVYRTQGVIARQQLVVVRFAGFAATLRTLFCPGHLGAPYRFIWRPILPIGPIPGLSRASHPTMRISTARLQIYPRYALV
jgi:hypothetical protein